MKTISKKIKDILHRAGSKLKKRPASSENEQISSCSKHSEKLPTSTTFVHPVGNDAQRETVAQSNDLNPSTPPKLQSLPGSTGLKPPTGEYPASPFPWHGTLRTCYYAGCWISCHHTRFSLRLPGLQVLPGYRADQQ
jgi:hypothetical protein